MSLVNYELKVSNSNNYSVNYSSSSPESFPQIMEQGIIIQYTQLKYASDLLEDTEEFSDKSFVSEIFIK